MDDNKARASCIEAAVTEEGPGLPQGCTASVDEVDMAVPHAAAAGSLQEVGEGGLRGFAVEASLPTWNWEPEFEQQMK